MEKDILRLKELAENSERIIIGGGAGLSASGGLNYADEEFFKTYYPEHYKLGHRNIGQAIGANWRLSSDNVHRYWGFWARHIRNIRYLPSATKPYNLLFKLFSKMEYFIITTNVDHQFIKAGFSEDKIFAPQGNYGRFQCIRPCSEALYENEDGVEAMLKDLGDDLEIRDEHVPLCPKCGDFLVPNLRMDGSFVEGENMKNANGYMEFLKDSEDKRLLLLELGVGFNTPGIIRFPFEKITKSFENATLVRINADKIGVPESISHKAFGIKGDINQALEKLI